MKKIVLILVIVLFASLFVSSQPTKNEKKVSNEKLAKSFCEAWSNCDGEKIASLFADIFTYEEVCSGRVFADKDALIGYINATCSGAPDLKSIPTKIISSGNQLVIEWIFKGTNTVGWPNIPANNGTFNLKGVSVMEIENGKIKNNREYWDWQTFARAVGAD